MEAEQIGVVLARASDLRSKVSICILNRSNSRRNDADGASSSGGVVDGALEEADEEREHEQEEEESLLHIRDALASLEQQLSSLQDLQQQQLYEREATLAQIDRSRMILLQKLKEYKGEEVELIHEAAVFAGETIKQDDDLLLPPYPSDLNEPDLVLDDIYSSNFVAKHKYEKNGYTNGSTSERKDRYGDSEKQGGTVTANGWGGGLKLFVGFITKSTLTILSAIALLSFAGYEAKFGRKGIQPKSTDVLQKSSDGDNRAPFQCPPGKLLIVEKGEARCVVKERIEIPLDSNVTSPSLSYGFG